MAASATLNFWKLLLWSRDLCPHVSLHLRSKFRINRPQRHRDILENDFQYGVQLPSWICRISTFLSKCPSSELKFASEYQIWSKLVNSRLRYGDKTIFKMAAVRHLEFEKIAVMIKCHCACDASSPIRQNPDPKRLSQQTCQLCLDSRYTVHSSNQSMEFRKRSGATMQPCLTPLSTGNHSDSYPSTRTQLRVSV